MEASQGMALEVHHEEHEFDHNSWIVMAGTALSGLGATLNGNNSLNGLAAATSHATSAGGAPEMAGSVASGAVALFGGWMAASKLSAIGSGMSLSTVGLGAGVAYASIGLLYFMYNVTRLSTRAPPRHSPVQGSSEAKLFPSPDWLSTRVLNWGVVGRVGVGKSTLINALRGLHPRNAEAAPVGIGHTTKRPKPYNFVGDVAVLTRNMARLWDLPGAGTKEWPVASYVRDAGLRHFDGVIFVTADAFSELEAALMRQLQEFQVPYYIVRNKVDQDVVNNADDHNRGVEETLAEIRYELVDRGCELSRTFLISAKNPKCQDYEFGMLLQMMANDVVSQRGELPEFVDESPDPLAPMLKDATAFAAASFTPSSEYSSGGTPSLTTVSGMSTAETMSSGRRWRRMNSPFPGPRSTSASSCETPPPTRLHTSRGITPEPITNPSTCAAPQSTFDGQDCFAGLQEPYHQYPCFREETDSTFARLEL